MEFQRALDGTTRVLDQIAAELSNPEVLPWPILLVRLCGSVLLCGLIGWEREVKDRPAGLRTHMLVGLAATVYSLLTFNLVATQFPETVRMDPLRIIEAVTSGVAFLAAGMVVFSKGHVRGLTTGAGMWLAAAVGLCCGMGLWAMAVVSTLLAILIMEVDALKQRRYRTDKGENEASEDD